MTGMLWFDNSKDAPLSEKVRKAASYYRAKYGITANVCYCHPSELKAGDVDQVDGLTVKPYRSIRPGNYFLGVEGD